VIKETDRVSHCPFKENDTYDNRYQPDDQGN